MVLDTEGDLFLPIKPPTSMPASATCARYTSAPKYWVGQSFTLHYVLVLAYKFGVLVPLLTASKVESLSPPRTVHNTLSLVPSSAFVSSDLS